MAFIIQTQEEAKAAAEELAVLKGHAKRARIIEKELKAWCECRGGIQIYHDGKTMDLDFHEPKKLPTGNNIFKDACEWPKKSNMALFAALIDAGVKPGTAWQIFRAEKKEVITAAKSINTEEFTSAVTDLASFKPKPKFGFITVGEEEEGNGGDETE